MNLHEDLELQKTVDLKTLSQGTLEARLGYYENLRTEKMAEWSAATDIRDETFKELRRRRDVRRGGVL